MKKLLPLLLLPLLLLGCQPQAAKNQRTSLTVSILPQKYFVEQIAGDDFDIHVAIADGASHSDYEPTPADLNNIYRSAAYLKMGQIGFEYSVLPKIITTSQIPVYDLSEGIVFENADTHHCCEHHGIDPHIWLSPKRVKTVALNIFRAVSELKPERTEFYEKNLHDFLDRIDSLDIFITNELAPFQHHSFLIYHPALTYFAEDYQLHQYSIETNGKEPSVTWLEELTHLIQNQDIKVVFIQSQYDTKNAQSISETTGIRLVVIDPMAEDWMNEMVNITKKFVENQ